MGFGKAFGLGLLTYMLLNLGLFLVVLAIMPGGATLIGALFTDIKSILLLLFMPAAIMAGSGFALLASIGIIPGTELMMIFMAIWLILPGLLGALVAGKSADSAGAGFGGWFLVPIICSVIIVVIALIIPELSTAIAMMSLLLGGGVSVTSGYVMIIIAGVTNGFFWSGVAAATAGP